PDKIERQVCALLNDPLMVASTSAHIRTNSELDLLRINNVAKFMQMNYSSLMFRKEIVSQIGDWDPVNRGGDSEFYNRLIEYVGSNGVIHIDRPLSFSRVREGS